MNTIDVYGDAAVFESLIDKSIEEFEDNILISIGSYAFAYCYSLTAASFPSVTSIGNYAFQNCSNLTTTSFPAAMNIGYAAFRSCYSLTTASFPSVTSIGSSAFANCYSLTTASFSAATSIGSSAFRECSNLTIASFPVATSIGSYAFLNCYNLATFVLGASSVASLANSNAFSSADSAIIYVPDSLVTAYQAATNWSYYSSRIKGISEL